MTGDQHPAPMWALSVRQPWATMIARGFKNVENRSRRIPTRHVGTPIAIHAPIRTFDKVAMPGPEATQLLLDAQLDDCLGEVFPRGVIVAVAWFGAPHKYPDRVTGTLCGLSADGILSGEPCSKWAAVDDDLIWHWPITRVLALSAPVLVTGRRGFWPLPEWADHEVRAHQLPGTAAQGGSR